VVEVVDVTAEPVVVVEEPALNAAEVRVAGQRALLGAEVRQQPVVQEVEHRVVPGGERAAGGGRRHEVVGVGAGLPEQDAVLVRERLGGGAIESDHGVDSVSKN
jgi:hypothetical protein